MKKLVALMSVMMLTLSYSVFASYGGGGGGGSGGSGSSGSSGSGLVKDSCPGGEDFSGSKYDGTCLADEKEEEEVEKTCKDPSYEVAEDGSCICGDLMVEEDGYCVISFPIFVLVAGVVYDDTNKNGRQDFLSILGETSEPGIQGALVTLKDLNGNVLGTRVTDRGGFYAFELQEAGTYKVHVVLPSASNNTWKSSLLALIAPPVAAATEYEFTVTVDEEDAGKQITVSMPVSDGGIDEDNITTETTDQEAEEMEDEGEEEEVVVIVEDDDSASLLDLLRERNEGRNDTDAVSPLAGDSAGEDLFDLPAVLPRTGASL